jgi:LysM repeat protein
MARLHETTPRVVATTGAPGPVRCGPERPVVRSGAVGCAARYQDRRTGWARRARWAASVRGTRERRYAAPVEGRDPRGDVTGGAPRSSLATGRASDAPGGPARTPRSGRRRLLAWSASAVVTIALAGAAGAGLAYVVASARSAPPPVTGAPPAATTEPSPTTPSLAPATSTPSGTASVAPPSPSAGSPGPSPRVHVVAAGENLTRIAAFYGVTVAAIVEANGLTDANSIRVGQALIIPAAPGPTPTARGTG